MSRINVDAIALTDGRFKLLAELLGYADADHARSKVEYVWLACTIRGELELPRWVVEQHLGPTGPEALVEAELARWTSGRGDSRTRRMYICGARGRTEWFTRLQEQSSKGGKARADKTSRKAGKFTSQVGGEETSPLTLALALTHAPERERGEPPPPEHSGPVRAPSFAPSPGLQELHTKTDSATGTPAHEVAQQARQDTRARWWSELEQLRKRVATKLGVIVRPLAAFDPGERELGARIVECQSLERFEADCAHVFAVAEAQALANREMRFLGGSMFRQGSWATALAMTLQDAKRPRGNGRYEQNTPTLVCSHGDEEEAS